MSDLPSVYVWMPWFIRDHRARAATLSHTEHSALCYLRMLLWESDGVIPDDDALIARELRLTKAQWLKMRPILLRECTLAGRQITDPAIVKEVAKAKKNVIQRSAAGRASAAARAASAAQRMSNGRSTDVATDVQPRAGAGTNNVSEDQQTQEIESQGVTRTRAGGAGLTVVGGRAK